mgnify:CR=1 FL=1
MYVMVHYKITYTETKYINKYPPYILKCIGVHYNNKIYNYLFAEHSGD